MRLCFVSLLVNFCCLEIKLCLMKMFDFTQFRPTKHFRINRLFSDFRVKLSGFLLTKRLFYLLKMLHFCREPETPSDSGITSRRRWLSFALFFGKKSRNLTLFVDFFYRKFGKHYWKTLNFVSKNGFKFSEKQLF